jgi:hypothetical protein
MAKLMAGIKLGQWIGALGQTGAAEYFGVLILCTAGDTNFYGQFGIIGDKRRILHSHGVDAAKEHLVKGGVGIIEGNIKAHWGYIVSDG